MTDDVHPALRFWLAWGRALGRYHRYQVTGLEHLDGPGAKLIVGFHGPGYASDLIILGAELHRRLGYMPHSIIHAYFDENRALKWLKDGLEFVTGDDETLRRAVGGGRHIILLPGGTREANRRFDRRRRIDWGDRTGFLRLAMKLGTPIVPVACAGVPEQVLGLNDGYRLGKRLGLPHQIPAWAAVGLIGLFPVCVPFPSRFYQKIGAPIDLAAEGYLADDPRERLIERSHRMQSQMQSLLDAAYLERDESRGGILRRWRRLNDGRSS